MVEENSRGHILPPPPGRIRLKLCQTQLNFAVFCASSASVVSSEHLNHKKTFYGKGFVSISHVLSRDKNSGKITGPICRTNLAADNAYTNEEFFKICEDYGVPNGPMRYRDKKFYWSYRRGIA